MAKKVRKEGRRMVLSSVIAAAKPKVPFNAKLKAFACTKCDHQFAVANVDKPFCVKCSSEDVNKLDKYSGAFEDVSPERDETLCNIHCASCNTHMILSEESALANASAGFMACVTCGTKLSVDVTPCLADNMGEVQNNTRKQPEHDKPDLDEDGNPDLDTVYSAEEGGEEFGGGFGGGSENDFDQVESDTEDGDSDADTDELDGDGDLGGDSVVKGDETQAGETLGSTVAMLSVALAKNSKEPIVEFLRNGNKVHAFVNDVYVATASKSDKNATMFSKPIYIDSLQVACSRNGLKQTLKDFHFVEAKVKVNAPALSQNIIKQAVEARVSKVKKDQNNYKEVLSQSLAIASAGLVRGFFKGKDATNPLRDTLVKELASLGIRNPETAVDKAIAKSADAYHKVLIDQALVLSSKSDEHRNELATALSGINIVTSSVDDSTSALSDNLSNGGFAAVASTKEPTSTKVESSIASLVRGTFSTASVQKF